MKRIILATLLLTITSCGQDESQEAHGGNYGWGTSGLSIDTIKSKMNSVANIIEKSNTIDSGEYISRSKHAEEPLCHGRPAYWSDHFEIAGESDSIPKSVLQKIAAMAEVNLQMLTEHLDVTAQNVIKVAHRDKIGICVLNRTSSNGSGHGSALVVSAYNSNAGEGFSYEFVLHKHELMHILDSQFNHNEYGYNLTPGWWVEGIAEVSSGARILSAKEWASYHNKYAPTKNIISEGQAVTGGYEAYPLYTTIVSYLQSQGIGQSNFNNFIKSDRWHGVDSVSTSSCPADRIFTGACNEPSNVLTNFEYQFNQALTGDSSLTSYSEFETNYYNLILNWLNSK